MNKLYSDQKHDQNQTPQSAQCDETIDMLFKLLCYFQKDEY